ELSRHYAVHPKNRLLLKRGRKDDEAKTVPNVKPHPSFRASRLHAFYFVRKVRCNVVFANRCHISGCSSFSFFVSSLVVSACFQVNSGTPCQVITDFSCFSS